MTEFCTAVPTVHRLVRPVSLTARCYGSSQHLDLSGVSVGYSPGVHQR